MPPPQNNLIKSIEAFLALDTMFYNSAVIDDVAVSVVFLRLKAFTPENVENKSEISYDE